MAGELTFSQKLEVDTWLKANEKNQTYFLQLNTVWQEATLEHALLDQDEQQLWLKLEEQLDEIDHNIAGRAASNNSTPNRHFLGQMVQVLTAAMFLIALFILAFKYIYAFPSDALASIDFAPNNANFQVLQRPMGEIQISSEQKNVFFLPDNTKVWLNKNSSLTYDKGFGDTIRRVILSGEGFFEVAKNEAIPFVILANGSETRVVGTRFNLKAYQDGPPAVSVVSGKVTFSATHEQDEKVTLTKGEKATLYVHERKLVKKKWEDQHTLDWKHLLVYQRELSQPVDYLENGVKWKKSIINQTEIKGKLSNRATLAIYKNIKLKITYKRKNKTKSNVFTVYKTLAPGQTITYKYRLADWFGKTKDLKIEVLDASVTRNQ